MNISQVWLMNIGEGVDRAFINIEDAYQATYEILEKWGYDPNNEDDKGIFDELRQSYEDENFEGFYVDEVIWCWAVDLH